MTLTIGRTRTGLVAGATLLLAACQPAPPINYYVLSAGQAAPPSGPVTGKSTLAIEPVELADYLDRPEIVTREAANAIDLADLHRWGEPLDFMVGRVLARNLAALLPERDVVLLPTSFVISPSRQLVVEVQRFDTDAEGIVTLDARWQIIDPRNESVVEEGRSHIEKNAGMPRDYRAISGAMSEALAGLAGEIAATLR
jgi:uncharacterized lipoprotein YmbA